MDMRRQLREDGMGWYICGFMEELRSISLGKHALLLLAGNLDTYLRHASFRAMMLPRSLHTL